MEDIDLTYNTRDLYFGAYLIAKGYILLSVELDSKGKFYWFIFNNKDSCLLDEQAFLQNELSIQAKTYSEAIKFLKRKVSEKGGIEKFKRQLSR